MAGVGLYREDGKPAQILRRGDVLQIPAGVRHWHGATKDNWFSQVVIYDSTWKLTEASDDSDNSVSDEYYNDGFSYWFNKHEEERMKQQNEYFRIVSDEEQLIRCRFRQPKPGEPFKRLNAATIAQMISYGRQPITSRRVSLVMKAIGFHSERNSKGCYYKLFEMDTNESQRVISDMLSASDQCNECSEELDLPF